MTNNIFKAYIRTQITEDKNSCKFSSTITEKETWLYEEPTNLANYGGILADEFVQLDFDTEEDSEIALKIIKGEKLNCVVVKTTRGIHAIFKNDNLQKQEVHVPNACGLITDFGLGKLNRIEPIRLITANGESVTRELIYADDIQIIPSYFKPVGNSKFDFKTSKSRNNDLFAYINVMHGKGFSKEEIKETLSVINQYVFPNPLEQRELDVILREDAFKNLSKRQSRPKHGEIAQFLLDNYKIVDISNPGGIPTLAMYLPEEKTYTLNLHSIEQVIIEHFDEWQLSSNERKEVIKYMLLKIKNKSEYADRRYIGMKDFIFDIETSEKIEYSDKYILQSRLQYNYKEDGFDPNAVETVEKYLYFVSCGDKQIRARMMEAFGASIYRAPLHRSGFIFFNETGGNSKGTFCRVMKKLNEGNFSSVDLHEIGGFNSGRLINKTVNFTDELKPQILGNTNFIKSMLSGETTSIREIYSAPIDVKWICTLICNGNHIPKSDDKTLAWIERWVIIPFNASMKKGMVGYDPNIIDKLTTPECMEYWLYLAVKALQECLERGDFSECEKSEKASEAYKIQNDTVLSWINDAEPKIENESVSQLYLDYCHWCDMNGERSHAKKDTFSKTIKREYGFEPTPQWMNGKTVRVYKNVA